MSVIVAIKYKNGIMVAADRQATSGNDTFNTTKIFTTKYSNIIMGFVGSLRDGNIISVLDEVIDYKDILDGIEIDMPYIIKVVVPKIFYTLKKNNRIMTVNGVDESSSSYMLCTDKSIFDISGDGAVIEANDFDAIGCGDQYAKGYLQTCNLKGATKKQALEYIKNAVGKACKSDPFIDNNIDILCVEGL